MTPQFESNLRITLSQPLWTSFAWAAACIACLLLAWLSSRLVETRGRPGARTAAGVMGVMSFGCASVPPAMMVVFKVWAVLAFG